MSDQPFLFDDFFVDERDPGVEMPVSFKGREVRLRVRRSISMQSREAISQSAIQRHLDTEEGKLVVDGISEAKLTSGLLHAFLLDWPFVRADGSKVPLTLEHVSALDPNFQDAAVLALKALTEAKEREADGPFASASAEDSATPDPAVSTSLPAASPSV